VIYPKIKLRKSAKRDFKTLQAFAKEAIFNNSRTLTWAVFNKYPELKMYFNKEIHYQMKNEEGLHNFINKLYRTRASSMEIAMIKHKKRWEQIAPKYFSLVDVLFDYRKWPPGKYIAFGTIWGMYPRFLDDKTFQIPYWHRKPRYAQVVIAHELLHFMFYDYFYASYPEYRRSKHNFFVWHVSEIFNTIVQNSFPWLTCFKLKSPGYPEHKKIISRISRTFYHRSTWNLAELVEEIIKEVRQQKSFLK